MRKREYLKELRQHIFHCSGCGQRLVVLKTKEKFDIYTGEKIHKKYYGCPNRSFCNLNSHLTNDVEIIYPK